MNSDILQLCLAFTGVVYKALSLGSELMLNP
jgi:hypothetical protein